MLVHARGKNWGAGEGSRGAAHGRSTDSDAHRTQSAHFGLLPGTISSASTVCWAIACYGPSGWTSIGRWRGGCSTKPSEWFREVEALGWDWVARIRGRVKVSLCGREGQPATGVYALGHTHTAKSGGSTTARASAPRVLFVPGTRVPAWTGPATQTPSHGP